MPHNMKLLSIIFIARAVQLLAMAGCATQLFSVARNTPGRPRLSLWFRRIAFVVAAFAICLTLATFFDAFEVMGIIWLSTAFNALFWVLIDLHLRATRRAARRTPRDMQGRVLAGIDEFITEMQQSKAKAARTLDSVPHT
jgi:hypothetical protein